MYDTGLESLIFLYSVSQWSEPGLCALPYSVYTVHPRLQILMWREPIIVHGSNSITITIPLANRQS